MTHNELPPPSNHASTEVEHLRDILLRIEGADFTDPAISDAEHAREVRSAQARYNDCQNVFEYVAGLAVGPESLDDAVQSAAQNLHDARMTLFDVTGIDPYEEQG